MGLIDWIFAALLESLSAQLSIKCLFDDKAWLYNSKHRLTKRLLIKKVFVTLKMTTAVLTLVSLNEVKNL